MVAVSRLALASADPDLNSTVVGGRSVLAGNLPCDPKPFIAALGFGQKRNGSPTAICTGSWLSIDVIVTAAHCISTAADGSQIRIGALGSNGMYSWDDTRVTVGRDTLVHPVYDGKVWTHDVAVILVREGSKVGGAVCLPSKDTPRPEADLITFGFGQDDNGNFGGLNWVDLPFVASDVCQDSWSLEGCQVCAGGVQGKDTCNGDSGGPLMYCQASSPSPVSPPGCTGMLVGSTSYGLANCGGGVAVYSDLQHFVAWLEDAASYLRVEPSLRQSAPAARCGGEASKGGAWGELGDGGGIDPARAEGTWRGGANGAPTSDLSVLVAALSLLTSAGACALNRQL